MDFLHYVALGDSMSIDLYPALDAGETDVAVALERDPHAGRVAPLGAASLFFQNDESRWPEEMGNDLSGRFPGISYQNFATDGATIGDVFGEQLAQLEPGDEPTLITLTVGQEDLYSAFDSRPKGKLLEHIVHDIAEAYEFLVRTIVGARRNATIILSTIYDPSDRTGRIPGILEKKGGPLPLHALDTLNGDIRALTGAAPRVLLAEVYGHFLGHGVSAPEVDRWYWRRSPIEPNVRGASEIRKVWMDALAGAEILEGEQR